MEFSFRINEFEWNKFDVREFVSVLIEVLWYCIGGLVLYGSTVLSKPVTQGEHLECFCIFGIGSCR